SVSAMTMMHTSRLCEDLVLWSTEEFGFIELPDAFATGSSIMPQKKNPDVPELVRGKTGRVYGNLVGILTMMKALPLSYNRDMQEDKIPVFDTVDTVKSVLAVLADMLPHIKFNRHRMAEAASRGFSTATDVAEYLVSKGVPFRTAHEVVGRLVRFCGEGGLAIEDLPIAKLREFSPLFQKDLYRLLSARSSVARKRSAGGTSPVLVAKRIRTLGRARKP
ncbi:MAG: argininosuccinate lyase, partial [Thermodesulfovibrionales bacterium]